MNLTEPPASSITFAANAGRRAGSIPARASCAGVRRAFADASTRTSRVGPSKPSRRAETSSSSRSGTGNGCVGSRTVPSVPSARASSNA